MDEREKRELYENSKIRTGTMEIAASSPELKGKIRSRVLTAADVVYWYIKFNLSLDPASVSRKTAKVTERNGYIVKTDISYNAESNVISICPRDCYAQNEYYLLHVSRKVRSAMGNNLRRPVNIMFKIVGNKIDEYRILPNNAKIPRPTKRPRGYVPKGELVYPAIPERRARRGGNPAGPMMEKRESLPFKPFRLNPVIALAGIIAAPIGIFLAAAPVVLAAAVACLAGLAHIIIQLMRKDKRSAVIYNMGVLSFAGGNYKKARKRFERAAELDAGNELAAHAAAKMGIYL